MRAASASNYGPGEPYLPVLEALAELCRSDNAVAPLLRAVAPTWLLQLPWLSTADERDALRRARRRRPDRMLREMGELLDRYTERRPLLLVTEDLHWSDRATIQLIDYIAPTRQRATDVAFEFSFGGGRRARSSAEFRASRAASHGAVR